MISDEFETYLQKARSGEQLQFEMHVVDAALLLRAVAASCQLEVEIPVWRRVFWSLNLLWLVVRLAFRSRQLVFLHGLCTVVHKPLRIEINSRGTSAFFFVGAVQSNPPIEGKV